MFQHVLVFRELQTVHITKIQVITRQDYTSTVTVIDSPYWNGFNNISNVTCQYNVTSSSDHVSSK